jgi:hypothetical protein
MQELRVCDRCGGSNLASGKFPEGYFVADNRKFLARSAAAVLAAACLDCGAIMLTTDPEKLRADIKPPKE